MGKKQGETEEGTVTSGESAPEMGRNRRVTPRYRVRYLSAVTPSLQGDVLNVSENGILIETTQAVVIGRSYALVLKDPANEVRIQATVRWCALDRNLRVLSGDVVPLYRVGLSFDNPPSNELWQMIRTVEEHNRLVERD